MASGSSRRRGQGSAVAAGADADATLTNPGLADLPGADIVVHLHRDDRSGSDDFADVALVLARRLTEAEARIREVDQNAAGLRETIRKLEERVANAEALARELAGGEIRARDLAIVVHELGAGETTPGVEATPAEGGDDDIPSPIPLTTIHAFLPVSVTAAPVLPGELIEDDKAVEEVIVDDAVPRSHEVAEAAGLVNCQGKVSEAIASKTKKPASHLSLPLDDFRSRRSSVPCEMVDSHLPYPHEHQDVDNVPSPIPLMRIDAFPVSVTAALALPDELIEDRARFVKDITAPRNEVVDCRDKVSEAITRKRKEPASDDISLTSDNLRVTGHNKVSEEEAHGEDVAASPPRGPQGEQPARATKKARGQQTSFYAMVHKALMEKQNLLRKKEREAIAKKAAAAACKKVHCRCWWSDAPC